MILKLKLRLSRKTLLFTRMYDQFLEIYAKLINIAAMFLLFRMYNLEIIRTIFHSDSLEKNWKQGSKGYFSLKPGSR